MSKDNLNKNCPGVKRLMREAAELAEPTEQYFAAPLEDNLFEWHFTVRGQEDTSFEGGVYHGRIILPPEYPLKPPSVILLTPNGRFELNRRICLSISEHHPETWRPSWSIRTVLLAIVGFMPTPGKGAIGALDWTDVERRKLAAASVKWSCKGCGRSNSDTLLPHTKQGAEDLRRETEKCAAEMSFTAAKDKTEAEGSDKAGAEAKNTAEAEDKDKAGSEGKDNTGSDDTAGAAAGDTAASSSEPAVTTSPSDTQECSAVQPAPEPAVTPATPAPPVLAPAPQSGGFFSLFLIYFLVSVISVLFLRRIIKGVYQEFYQTEPF